MLFSRLIVASLAIALLAGCASYGGAGLKPGVDTEAKVRATMGEPALRFQDPRGESTWAYPRGPVGFHTFMAHFTSSGTLVGIESVLDEEHFRRVLRGLGKDDVQRILGPPGVEDRFPRRNEIVWDYRFMDLWGYASNFSVIFDAQGLVSHTLTWRELHDDND